MNYNELEKRQRNSLRAVTDIIVFLAMIAIAGLCAYFLALWITGSEWWAHLIAYIVAGVMWFLMSMCWISDREDRSMGAK